MHLITVRQTIDPYLDDIEYIAWREVPLERDGSLSMSKIGLGMPGDKFMIVSREVKIPTKVEQPDNSPPVITLNYPISGIVYPHTIQLMASRRDSGPHPILTVVERRDYVSGSERHQRRIDARYREEQLAYLKGLVSHAWNWVTPVLGPSSHDQVTSQCQPPDSISTIPEGLRPEYAVSTSVRVAHRGNTSRLVHRHKTAEVPD